MDNLNWIEKVIVNQAILTISLHLHLPLAADRQFIEQEILKVFESGKLRGKIEDRKEEIEDQNFFRSEGGD